MSGYRRESETIVVFRVADFRFGIAAAAVEEICGVEDLKPLPAGSRTRSMKHSLTRRGREHWVIDGAYFFRMLPARAERLLVLRHEPVAILIGNVDCMQDIACVHEMPRSFQGEERRWFRGLIRSFDALIPLVDPQCFVDVVRAAKYQSAVPSVASQREAAEVTA